MCIQPNPKNSFTLYVMLIITLFLVAGVIIYLSHSATTEETLRTDKNITTLNGPWKFIVGDNIQYAQSDFMIRDGKPWTLLHLREHMMTMWDFQAIYRVGLPKGIQTIQVTPGIE
jgi:hypothetical protein